MIEIKVVRKVKSYILRIGMIDWEILLDCGHRTKRTTEDLKQAAFRDKFQCQDCEKMALRNLEQFHTSEDKNEKPK